ncbi:MAG: HAD-IA family hydrolase [Actinomycetota bacterium]|nr:HAD-IA family hydrolase [Actinomycetota bacterium]
MFDLFITLTDWEAERRRPRLTDELAAALGVDPSKFSSLMRATFTERVAGRMGDARATFSALATQLGCDPSPADLDQVMAMRHDQTRQTLAPRAGALDVMRTIRTDGYAVGVLTDCTAETVELWPSLPYSAVVDAVTFSCEVGQRKPHPAGYRDISRKLGVPPEECLYVGDGSSAELSGATSAGMTAVLLETPFGTDFRYDAESRWTGRSVSDLHQVRRVLRDLNLEARDRAGGQG